MDLSDLDSVIDIEGAMNASSSDGKPLQILLSDIQENPDNPRAEFDIPTLQELADDIKANGVISPVSVFLSPEGSAAKYTLNYGARRFRASELAGMETIPAFVDVEMDCYQRVAENEQRQQLAPLDLAVFIKSRLEAGESQSQIAKRMNKTDSYVSEQLSLLGLEGEVMAAWNAGKITSVRYAVELSNHTKKLTDTGKERVSKAIESTDNVSRTLVETIKKDTAKNVKKTDKKPSISYVRKPPKKTTYADLKNIVLSVNGMAVKLIDQPSETADTVLVKFASEKQPRFVCWIDISFSTKVKAPKS